MSHVRGEGLTRIALRKYTSFGDHLAVKHFGARPSIHPNINRFSVTLRLRAVRRPVEHTSKHQPFQRQLSVKHFGARPSIHPNINPVGVTLRLSISEPGLAYIQTSTVSASPCG